MKYLLCFIDFEPVAGLSDFHASVSYEIASLEQLQIAINHHLKAYVDANMWHVQLCDENYNVLTEFDLHRPDSDE
jgi:hypothetical protein